MYNITKNEVLSLLENMRQIRQKTGEMIAYLEHLMQLQEKKPLRELSYNPDDYLEDLDYHAYDRVRSSLYCDCSCECDKNARSIDTLTTIDRESPEQEKETQK